MLVEHYAGAFPPWLAPVQVVGIPITDEHAPYLDDVAAQLRARGIRVEVDTSDDRMQKKIRTAQKQKVPFMLLAGDEDVAKGAVSFRYRSGEQNNGVPVGGRDRGDRARRRRPGAGVTRGASDAGPEIVPQEGVGTPDRLQRLWAPHRLAYINGEDGTGQHRRRRLPVLPDPDAGRPDRAGASRAARRSTRCSTCTRTTPGT